MRRDSLQLPPLAELISLQGRVAIVAGGSGGMGTRIAARLAEAGAKVTLADIDLPATLSVASAINERFPATCRAVKLDIADADAVNSLSGAIADADGRLDIWVNAAAIFGTHPVAEIEDRIWEQMLAVNLSGSFYCARAAARHMGARGVIVLITSLAAGRGRAGRTHYGAAKHGTDNLTRSLAIELGPLGIRVLSVAPSVTATPALEEGLQYGDSDGEAHRRVIELATSEIPLGRIGQPDEIARAVLFAVSDMASFITGSTIHVDGGASAG